MGCLNWFLCLLHLATSLGLPGTTAPLRHRGPSSHVAVSLKLQFVFTVHPSSEVSIILFPDYHCHHVVLTPEPLEPPLD
ncbi:putative zinc finger DHHC domain-containing protein [Sesbania bispinosa]|nr:putative zinc finger DHHC domain-containing protein [Sesbania bispinosa]